MLRNIKTVHLMLWFITYIILIVLYTSIHGEALNAHRG